MDKMSIITTFYNAKEFIEHTLSSILKQKTDKTFEIEYVLVDDHSPDSSREIVEEFMRTHTLNFIRLSRNNANSAKCGLLSIIIFLGDALFCFEPFA